MSDVIREAAGSAEYVLLDGAPVLGYSGTLQLAPRIDLVLFVARARGYVAPVQRALRALCDVGAEVPGIVVNDVMPTDKRYYGYPSYYHYYYYQPQSHPLSEFFRDKAMRDLNSYEKESIPPEGGD